MVDVCFFPPYCPALDRGLSHRWPTEGGDDDTDTGAPSEPPPRRPTTHNVNILPAAVSMATSAPPTARPRLRRWWPHGHLGTRPARTAQAAGKSIGALARGSGSCFNAGLRGGQGGLWGHFRSAMWTRTHAHARTHYRDHRHTGVTHTP